MGGNPSQRNSWIVWYVIAMHWLWGSMLQLGTAPLGITAISSLTHFGFVSAPYVGLMLLTVSMLAAISRAAPKSVSLLFMIPQQLVLVVSALGAITAMQTGTFADGEVRPIPFIVADQAPSVLIAVFHILSVYSNYFYPETRSWQTTSPTSKSS